MTSSSNENKEQILQLVSFKLGKEEFGVDILKVQEIIKLIDVTTVPNAPKFVEGVINLRGRVIPIIDLRVRLGMERKDLDNKSRIIVVELDGKTIGFIVDEVNEVLRIPTNIIEPPPDMVLGIDTDYIIAVGKLEEKLLILLDLEKVLSTNEKEVLSTIN
ncbi:MAG: chemotaxis protein CheW [Ignavibacterium sp.]